MTQNRLFFVLDDFLLLHPGNTNLLILEMFVIFKLQFALDAEPAFKLNPPTPRKVMLLKESVTVNFISQFVIRNLVTQHENHDDPCEIFGDPSWISLAQFMLTYLLHVHKLTLCHVCSSLFSDLRNLSGTTLMNLLAALFMTQLLYVIGVGGVPVSSQTLKTVHGIFILFNTFNGTEKLI